MMHVARCIDPLTCTINFTDQIYKGQDLSDSEDACAQAREDQCFGSKPGDGGQQVAHAANRCAVQESKTRPALVGHRPELYTA